MTVLNIPSKGALDLVALGALVHRLDPGVVPFRKASECHIHVSGGEFNVAANLSDCFRMSTAIATAMVDYPIGDLIAERVRAMGVRRIYKRFAHDGVTGPNMAAVYSDRGQGVRAPVVFYNRCNEAAAQLQPGDFDWKAIFAGGVRWFHSGGIFAALSPTTAPLVAEMMKEAKAAGATLDNNGEGGLAPSLVLGIMRRDHFRCVNEDCPTPQKNLSLDHISGHPKEIAADPEARHRKDLKLGIKLGHVAKMEALRTDFSCSENHV